MVKDRKMPPKFRSEPRRGPAMKPRPLAASNIPITRSMSSGYWLTRIAGAAVIEQPAPMPARLRERMLKKTAKK